MEATFTSTVATVDMLVPSQVERAEKKNTNLFQARESDTISANVDPGDWRPLAE